jgi:hypothetical protein
MNNKHYFLAIIIFEVFGVRVRVWTAPCMYTCMHASWHKEAYTCPAMAYSSGMHMCCGGSVSVLQYCSLCYILYSKITSFHAKSYIRKQNWPLQGVADTCSALACCQECKDKCRTCSRCVYICTSPPRPHYQCIVATRLGLTWTDSPYTGHIMSQPLPCHNHSLLNHVLAFQSMHRVTTC